MNGKTYGPISRGYFSIMGGLGWCSHLIKANTPEHLHRLELTCGRGEAIWALRRPSGRELLNDKDAVLMRMHRTVQGLSDSDFANLARKNWKLTRALFNHYRDTPLPEGDLDFLHRMVYLFAGGKRGDEVFKDVFWDARLGKDIRGVVGRIRSASRRLNGVGLFCLDAIDALEQIQPCESWFVFIDPPYPSRERYYSVHDLDWKLLRRRLEAARFKWLLVSDKNVSPRVGRGKRLGKLEVVDYIMQSHGELMALAGSFPAFTVTEPFRMNQQFRQRLNFQGRQKEYLFIANYPIVGALKQADLPGLAIEGLTPAHNPLQCHE